MSFIPFDNCCEAAIEFDLAGIASVITLGFRSTVSEPFSVTDLADLATVIETQLVVPLAAIQAPTAVYRNIHLRDLDSVSGNVYDQPLTAVGSEGNTPVANQVAMTVTFLTGIAGRSYRGRNYVAGWRTQNLLNPTTFNSDICGIVAGIYETFDGALPAVSASHVVLSRFLDKSPRELGHAQDIIGYRANTQVHTQRRRLT